MKKIAAMIIAVIMVLSCTMTAFAEVKVTGGHFIGTEDDVEIWEPQSGRDAGESVSVTDASKAKFVGDLKGDKDMNVALAAADGDGSTVEVTGNVEGVNRGIRATDGATVNVGGSVQRASSPWWPFTGIDAFGAKVNVAGDVTSNMVGIQASDGADVEVMGTVKGMISADDSTIKIGTDANNGVFAQGMSYIIVEGTAENVMTKKKSSVYIGQLEGDIDRNPERIHYLIGTKDGQNDKINVIGEIISTDTADGVKNQGYHYTTTADAETLNGQSFVIKSTDRFKKIRVDGTYAGVTIVNNPDGTATLTLESDFKGGIQALELIFEDIFRKSSGGSSGTIFTGTPGRPVTNGKWIKNADGTWSYATAYKFTDTWGYIADPNDAGSAAWYYFDRNGNMLTGWQRLYWNGSMKWFYFSQKKDADEGKCQLGGVTPDGHTVDETGAWTGNEVIQ